VVSHNSKQNLWSATTKNEKEQLQLMATKKAAKSGAKKGGAKKGAAKKGGAKKSGSKKR
jgi:hypothetical protein